MFSLNADQKAVVDFVAQNLNRNILITGIGGTGKSAIIRDILALCPAAAATTGLTAPTGCAGEHIGGTTIHNFLGMGKVDEETTFDEVFGRVLGQPVVVDRIRGFTRHH
jgi:hypothetical protein